MGCLLSVSSVVAAPIYLTSQMSARLLGRRADGWRGGGPSRGNSSCACGVVGQPFDARLKRPAHVIRRAGGQLATQRRRAEWTGTTGGGRRAVRWLETAAVGVSRPSGSIQAVPRCVWLHVGFVVGVFLKPRARSGQARPGAIERTVDDGSLRASPRCPLTSTMRAGQMHHTSLPPCERPPRPRSP